MSNGRTELANDTIHVRGAREHNLKNIEIELPKNQLVVFTGPSGSGKSSLAFDTLYAEGQRRYVESLSAYARQFLGQMDKPEYDHIRGLSPTISIDQKAASSNPRSTVGTITEIYDYLRVLFARAGEQHCHECGKPVHRTEAGQIVREVQELEERTRYMVLAPLVTHRKGEYRDLFEHLRRQGYTRVRVDDEIQELAELEALEKNKKHTIEIVVDRLIAKPGIESRVADSVETALEASEGWVRIVIMPRDGEPEERLLSEHNMCGDCGIAFPDLIPQSFSFNSPLGLCPSCNGLGTALAMDPDKVVPDVTESINGGAVKPLKRRLAREERWMWRVLHAWCDKHGYDRTAPWTELPHEARHAILYGAREAEELDVKGRKHPVTVRFGGVIPYLMRRFRDADNESTRERFAEYLSQAPCPDCGGSRLRAESRAVLIGDQSIDAVCRMTIAEARAFLDGLELDGERAVIAAELLKEIGARLGFLLDVGLSYLSLERAGPTLSGGESQRIRLASQLGSELSGVLYILDEPSIGLHQRDNARLLGTLKRLRDLGNSVLVVEHDRETMEEADWLVDFGPGAGVRGGQIVFSGPPAELRGKDGSITGDYLFGRREIALPAKRRAPGEEQLRVIGAHHNNLKGIDVDFPLGTFICVTGVSGAGKSTLVNDVLYETVRRALSSKHRSGDPAGCNDVDGLDEVDKVIRIDQQPIGRTPRSNPATYTKVFDAIRQFFASLPESEMYGYKPGRFSFNVKGGRCESCQGAGVKQVEMHFLADVYVPCEVCGGRRFNDATLRVRYRGESIADVLAMTVDEALELFEAHPRIVRILSTLADVGLGYMPLGQSSPTLSGGEAQRVKLSRELAKVATGNTLYILDEPSTGLHFEDIRKLIDVLQRLVDAGNTVVMIEHNLDIIKVVDHVIDLGPEGGEAGGQVIALGTPEEVADIDASYTGRFLRPMLGRDQTGTSEAV